MHTVVFFILSLFIFACFCQEPIEITQLGVPMTQEIQATADHRFFIDLDFLFEGLADDEDASIVVTPLSGDVDLLVAIQSGSSYPTKDYCSQQEINCMTSQSVYGEIVYFTKQTSHIQQKYQPGTGQKLKMRIINPGNTPYDSSQYQINVFTQQTQLQLTGGLPQVVRNFEHDYQYMKFHLEGEDALWASVTPIAGKGDPDLYLSAKVLKPDQSTPSSDKWYSWDTSYDVIEADPEVDPSKFVGNTDWGIGVRSIFREEFLYCVSWARNNNFTRLMEGVPVGSHVGKQKYKYFSFYLPKIISESNALTVVITNKESSGDPDLYINGPTKDWSKPGRGNSEWSSTGRGADQIEINNPEEGYYKIGVYGFKETEFTISAITEHSVYTVSDRSKGISVNIQPGKYKYFKFPNIDTVNNINVNVDIRKGNAELYLAYPSSHNTRPQEEEGKHDEVGLKMFDTRYFNFNNPTESGNYYFSVKASSFYSANVTVTVSTNQTHTPLINEKESYGKSVPQGSYRYFKFDLGNTKLDGTWTVTAKPTKGDVSLFVSTNSIYPREDDYQWKSESYKTDTVSVYNDDAKINGTVFYIGVQGSKYYQTNEFSILAYIADKEIELFEGKTLGGSVKVGKYAEYKFYIHSISTLKVFLQQDIPEDEIVIYVAQHPSPSSHDYQWKSTSGYGDVFVELNNIHPGQYYVAVYGKSKSQSHGLGDILYYDISLTSFYRYCRPNVDTNFGIVSKNEIEQIHAFVDAGTEFLIISNYLVSGDTELYVSTNGSAVDIGPNNHMWKKTAWPGNSMIIKNTDPKFKDGQYWGFGIRGIIFSNYLFSIDTIPFGFFGSNIYENSPKLLNFGKKEIGKSANRLKYYFSIEENDDGSIDDYFVDIKVKSGNIEVYLNQDWNGEPGPTTENTWSSIGLHDRVMTLSASDIEGRKDPKLKSGYMFMTVHGVSEKNENELEIFFYKKSSPQYIRQDISTEVMLYTNLAEYFKVLAVKTDEEEKMIPAFIHIDSCDNFEAQKVYANVETREKEADKHPDSGHYDIKSESETVDQHIGVVSQVININSFKHPESYYLAVKYSTPSMINIFVTAKMDSRPTPHSKSFIAERQAGNNMDLYVPKAEPSQRYEKRSLAYDVYVKEIKIINGHPDHINMGTVCAIKNYGKKIGSFNDTTLQPVEKRGMMYFQFPFKFEHNKVYKLNVIVHDGYGLSQTYKQLWIIHGEAMEDWPGEDIHFDHYSVIGWIFIAVFFIIVILIHIVAFIINIIQKKKGLELIPFFKFWKEFPLNLWNGVLFIVTCGKRTRKYTNIDEQGLDDEPTGYNDVDDNGTINSGDKGNVSKGDYVNL